MPLSGGVLITGGTGSLGILTSGWLLERQFSHFRLGGRSGHCPDYQLRKLVRASSAVSICRVDVGCQAECAAFQCVSYGRSYHSPPWTSRVHAGGLLVDATVGNQSSALLRASFAPKVNGLLNLHQWGGLWPQQMGIAFSSVASLLGSPGQANYSAANAVLDFWCDSSQCKGISTVSIQWGAWAGGGMSNKDKSTARTLERMGMSFLQVEEGFGALQAILCGQCVDSLSLRPLGGQAVAVPFQWKKFCQNLRGTNNSSCLFVEDFNPRDLPPSADDKPYQHVTLQERDLGDKTKNDKEVFDSVAAAVKIAMGEEIPPDQPLMAAGLDSLGAISLKDSLVKAFGADLPDTLAFDYPTIDAIHTMLMETVFGVITQTDVYLSHRNFDGAERAVSYLHAASWQLPCSVDEDIPHDTVMHTPTERWDVEAEQWATAKAIARFGSFLKSIDKFDGVMFNVSASEAMAMDPQHRLLLESSLSVLYGDRASSTNVRSQLDDCDVVVGIAPGDYQGLCIQHRKFDSTFTATGTTTSLASGRLSYVFGMHGRCLSIDTACSSSLTALHIACFPRQLSPKLVGGVQLYCTPWTTLAVGLAGMLSPEGRCKTLDSAANGYARGEACLSFLVLTEPGDVSANKSAVSVMGTAINQDGRSSTLTAPHGPSQQQVIMRALCDAECKQDQMDKVQLHGTGTLLGDPIEMGAFTNAIAEPAGVDTPVAVAASKAIFAHTEAAAGLLSVALAWKYSLNCSERGNAHLRFVSPMVISSMSGNRRAPFRIHCYIARDRAAMPTAKSSAPCIDGISAFAFQGSNAHAILQSTIHPIQHNIYAEASKFRTQLTSCYWPANHMWLLPVHATVSTNQITISAFLGRPGCSFLLDHVVLDRMIFPGAGYMELVSSASSLVLESGEASAAQGVLVGGSIPQPLVLQPNEAAGS
eukprot:scaffold1006_cov464-Pavlova_lutheri.AAC.1